MVGSVYCYDTEGTLVKTVGHQGGTYGTLSLPIAASLDSSGNLLVLDKHRHTVVGYDSSGRVIGEIGGRGSSPGWFYHPISLLVDSQDRIWVTQTSYFATNIPQTGHLSFSARSSRGSANACKGISRNTINMDKTFMYLNIYLALLFRYLVNLIPCR